MSNKLVSKKHTSGLNVYVVAKNLDGDVWDVTLASTTYTAIDAIDWENDAGTDAPEQNAGGAASGQYRVEIPAALPHGVHEFSFRQRAGGTKAITDTELELQRWYWDGSNKHESSFERSDLDQERVPTERTWVLKQTAGEGLVGEATKSVNVGDTLTFAVDFRNDLPTGGYVNVVGVPTLIDAASGLTFGTRGRKDSQAKIRITASTAGTYTIDVPVTYDSGSMQSATVKLKVVE